MLIAKNKSKQIYKIYKETSQSRDVSVRMNLLQAGLLKERKQYIKALDIVRVAGVYTAHVHFQTSRASTTNERSSCSVSQMILKRDSN